jgi:hypothetical protein
MRLRELRAARVGRGGGLELALRVGLGAVVDDFDLTDESALQEVRELGSERDLLGLGSGAFAAAEPEPGEQRDEQRNRNPRAERAAARRERMLKRRAAQAAEAEKLKKENQK